MRKKDTPQPTLSTLSVFIISFVVAFGIGMLLVYLGRIPILRAIL